jgi:hypothetical protein
MRCPGLRCSVTVAMTIAVPPTVSLDIAVVVYVSPKPCSRSRRHCRRHVAVLGTGIIPISEWAGKGRQVRQSILSHGRAISLALRGHAIVESGLGMPRECSEYGLRTA